MDSTANSSIQLVYAFISQQLEAVDIRAEIVTHEHSVWLALRSSGEMDSLVAH